MSSAYSLCLFSYIQHGNMVSGSIKLSMGKMKEFMIFIMHFFPLILFLLNLGVFM